MRLQIGDGFSIPAEEAFTQTFGILAKRGVGKTYCAMVIAEEMLKAHGRVVIVDPVGVTWGLRSSADGKRSGLPIYVFGGESKARDLPLENGSGELIADLVVDERLSVVLDLSHFRKNEQANFMTAFAERLYHRNRDPLHVFLDEADAFAPQKPPKGHERMLGAIEDLVRRGRARGIGLTLITQRSAVLNKDVLTQIEVLITLRTISPQDREAIDAWIKVHGTPAERLQLLLSLPSLPVGTAWFWSPGWPTGDGIFQRVKVRARDTFDSSSTPKAGERRVSPKVLADVDLAALRDRMAATIERAKETDPRLMRKELDRLRAENKNVERLKSDAAKAKEELSAAHQELTRARSRADNLKADNIVAANDGIAKRIEASADRLAKAIETFTAKNEAVVAAMRDTAAKLAHPILTVTAQDYAQSRPVEKPLWRPTPAAEEVVFQVPGHSVRNNGNGKAPSNSDDSLGLAERRILTVLAQYREGCAAGKLAFLAGYRWSGGFRNALSNLRTQWLIEGGNKDVMRITEKGLQEAGTEQLPSGRALIEYWLNHRSLGKAEKSTLQVLLDHPKGLVAAELCAKAGYEWSGGYRNALSNLRTAGLLVGRNGEVMRASDELLEAVR